MSTSRNRERHTKHRSHDTTPENSLGSSSDRGDSNVIQQYQPQELQQQQQSIQGTTSGSRSGARAVRLDMDLDIDLQLKAKIKGDITLSILGGDQK
ncbi:hypothetical protein B0H65DRAFT_78630 [Neurospora tetraspora]|uniref:Uncharacterized protein n=1 Tax=Neurospora tetraspora TaxID=94610 RepID=A0AAE0IZT9_9PEZI|nr:hypothetical protein B0H65DRAFT_78630 [Neurospora tetraspora]